MAIKFFIASNKFDMLNACILQNKFIQAHSKLISYNDDEKGLSERNNEFINQNLNSDSWLVLCHDDVAFLEDPTEKIEALPKDKIYGLCGVRKIDGKGEIIGQIRQPRPDGGEGHVLLGKPVEGHETVDTFDSLCTIVHSSLFASYPRLRFDENLMYHMHVEELSIYAKERYKFESAVVQIDVIHMSWGKKDEAYFKAVEYVKQKHNLRAYICTCDRGLLDNQPEEGWKKNA